jgi:hypothetical protein
LFRDGGSPADYGSGMQIAIERGWLDMHRSGTYVKFTPVGAELGPTKILVPNANQQQRVRSG